MWNPDFGRHQLAVARTFALSILLTNAITRPSLTSFERTCRSLLWLTVSKNFLRGPYPRHRRTRRWRGLWLVEWAFCSFCLAGSHGCRWRKPCRSVRTALLRAPSARYGPHRSPIEYCFQCNHSFLALHSFALCLRLRSSSSRCAIYVGPLHGGRYPVFSAVLNA